MNFANWAPIDAHSGDTWAGSLLLSAVLVAVWRGPLFGEYAQWVACCPPKHWGVTP